MQESGVLRTIWLAVAASSVMFRINTGKAWVRGGPGEVRRLGDGSVVIPGGRPVALGLAKPNGDPVNGTGDLIGWTPIVITPEMVGRTVAVFTAIECKNSKGGRVGNEQDHFVSTVRAAGGIAGIASSPDMARLLIFEYSSRLIK